METREDLMQGYRRVTVSNGRITVEIIPELGGKVVSLKKGDREWLHLNQNIGLKRPVYGGSYVRDYDSGGWDECLPSITGETHASKGVEIPDHGELWGLPWEWEINPLENRVVIRSWVRSSGFAFEFHRDISISLGSNTIEVTYTLSNLSEDAFPYLWSAHPLLNIEENMQISLPPGSPVRLNSPANLPTGEWPYLTPSTPIHMVPSPSVHTARKVFVGPLSEGWVSLTSPSGESIRYSFDHREIPYVGLWQNYGGWSGNEAYEPYYNLGIEPCSGMPDSLEVARNWGTCPTLPPHQTHTWALSISLS